MQSNPVLEKIKNGLVVSCQTSIPLSGPQFMGPMAQAAVLGGAVGIRANGQDNVAAIRKLVEVPIIGINKQRTEGFQVYITPTLESALVVIEAGAEIIALDGSTAPRPSGIQLEELIQEIHKRNTLVMADISTLEEGIQAARAGADIVSSTLSGYTPYSPQIPGPDLDLIESLVRELDLPIIAEGRYNTPADVQAAFDRGVFAVVVGRAITEPQLITRRFAQATPREQHG